MTEEDSVQDFKVYNYQSFVEDTYLIISITKLDIFDKVPHKDIHRF
jgi:hypothetical protein